MFNFALSIIVLLSVSFGQGNALLFAEVRKRLKVLNSGRLTASIEGWVR
jgi:hypothetical protein